VPVPAWLRGGCGGAGATFGDELAKQVQRGLLEDAALGGGTAPTPIPKGSQPSAPEAFAWGGQAEFVDPQRRQERLGTEVAVKARAPGALKVDGSDIRLDEHVSSRLAQGVSHSGDVLGKLGMDQQERREGLPKARVRRCGQALQEGGRRDRLWCLALIGGGAG